MNPGFAGVHGFCDPESIGRFSCNLLLDYRYGQHPAEWLVDGRYPAQEQLEEAAASTIVYAPVPKPKGVDTDPHLAKTGDRKAIAAWRARMGTDEAKDIDKDRAATAECVNAQARERGPHPPAGPWHPPKVRCVLLL